MTSFSRRSSLFRSGILFALIAFLSGDFENSLQAQAPYFRWVKKAGGTADDVGNGVAVDGAGNSFVTGYYKSINVLFGSTLLPNAGGAEVFVAKYDFTGNAIWARRAGGSGEDVGEAVALDPMGNAYITGYFLSTNIIFGNTILTNRGSAEIFVAKYDPAGTLLWARSAGGDGYDAATAIAADAAGNCYVTGFSYSTNAFFGNIAVTNRGQSDIFLAKYDASGNVLWTQGAGGTSFDVANGVGVDGSGNSYITGNFLSPTNVFATGMTLTNSGQYDIFLAKYNPVGTPIYARRVHGTSDDFAYGIVIDVEGNPYITGTFRSPIATFSPAVVLTNGGFDDIFVAKFTRLGAPMWAKKAGGSSDDYSYAITIDPSTNIYVTGNFYSTNCNFSGTILTNIGGHDIFVARYDAVGNLDWVRRAGGTGLESANSVAVDVGGNSYLAGLFSGGSPNFSGISISSAGAKDLFLAQLDGDPPGLYSIRSTNSLVLLWRTNNLGFKLEQRTGLGITNSWTAATNASFILGNFFVATNSSGENVFFRLRK